MGDNTLLQTHLSMAVPLLIAEIQAAGGPTTEMLQKVSSYSRDMGAHGDAILFYQKGKTTEMINKLVEAMAVLSFCPGGITVFGVHFEVESSNNDVNNVPTQKKSID